MNINGIHHVTLIVNDTEQARWFYGEVLGLEEKHRPGFDFPGLFYRVGEGQEIHLIVTSRPLSHEDLFIRVGSGTERTLRHIHRHAALRVSDLPAYEQRLEEYGVEILFSESRSDRDDKLTGNMMAGWRVGYGGLPLFCEDPFENLLELVPLG
jgi:catechol 2,3-dioxygenase-like lactoylglutathione lyase family enzyme